MKNQKHSGLVRIALVILLGSVAVQSHAQDVSALIARLTEKDVAVRQDAAEQLGKSGPAATGAIPALIGSLKDSDVRVRANAAWALGKIQQNPEKSIPALIDTFQDDDWTVRHNASLSITWFGPQSVPALEKALTDGRERVRLYAVSALNRIDKGKNAVVLPVLEELLGRENAEVRLIAVQTIVAIGAPAAGTVPKLTSLLADKSPLVQLNSITALGAIGKAAKPAVPELTKLLLPISKTDVRIAAVTALFQIGEDPELWVPNAIKMFAPTTSESIPAAAVRALAAVGGKAVPLLASALRDADGGTREFAAETLALIGPPAAAAAPELIALLSDSRWQARRRAADALAHIGVADEKILDALRKASRDSNETVQASAKVALERLAARKSAK